MQLYTTTIKAIDPKDGELKVWNGVNVPGLSFSDAQRYCEQNGLGYCEVNGMLVAELDSKSEKWDKMTDADSVRGN